MSSYLIRPARPNDLDAMVGLLEILFALESDFAFDAVFQKNGLRKLLATETAVVLVAEIDGQVVGMISGQLTVSTAEGGYALLVEDVVIEPAFRWRGLGRRLLNGLEKWAAVRGVRRLQLLADKENFKALDFYHRLGWFDTRLICLWRQLSPDELA